MLSRDSENKMWSRFVIWPQEVTLARGTQPSGPLCLWQCFFLIIFRLFLDIKLLWQSKWPWRWNNDNTHQCAQPPTAIQNMRSIMLNIKQIVSRKEENGVYSSKRGLMEHVKRRKAPSCFESYHTYFLAESHVMHASWQTFIFSNFKPQRSISLIPE